MLESLTKTGNLTARSINVIWGGRTPQDMYSDFSDLPINWRFTPVLSRAEPSWTGARGHVQHVLLSTHPDLSRSAVYACGSDAMIRDARALLVEHGLPEKRFYSDAFVCSSSQPTNEKDPPQ